MNQPNLFSGEDTTRKQPVALPDPNKYQADRIACTRPELHPSTAYQYGCRCRGCYKYHSAMAYRRKLGPLPCAFPGCSAPRRQVQRAKYCDDHTTSRNYEPQRIQQTCASCGQTKPIARTKKYIICSACHDQHAKLITQATAHKATQEALVQWMKSPECALCNKRFYTGRGRTRSAFTIDHDHTCCHGGTSCGQCIRGILCSSCNMSLGHVEAMIARSTLPSILHYIA